ncbi:TPA: glycosyltransferase, partial [Candidatus Bathyarchaeota archaeon]|nr:glycosyltransferase [Candidatus Bathyarchaeota archaeon]
MISVILPTKNEPKVSELIASIRKELEKLGEEYEILVVDKSSDDTPEKARLAGAKVLKQESDGLGNAIKEGVALARGGVILVMDADFSHDPRHIPTFLKKIKSVDIVVGARKVPGGNVIGWSWRRKLISWAANFLARA